MGVHAEFSTLCVIAFRFSIASISMVVVRMDCMNRQYSRNEIATNGGTELGISWKLPLKKVGEIGFGSFYAFMRSS
jgi:hypothetical protein